MLQKNCAKSQYSAGRLAQAVARARSRPLEYQTRSPPWLWSSFTAEPFGLYPRMSLETQVYTILSPGDEHGIGPSIGRFLTSKSTSRNKGPIRLCLRYTGGLTKLAVSRFPKELLTLSNSLS